MFQEHYDSQLDRFKESFLTEAARCGRTEEVASLIDLGARVDWSPDNQDTPLLLAVKNGHLDVATILIANGADIYRKSEGGNNVLHLASMAGNEEMCALLISATSSFQSRGIDINNSDVDETNLSFNSVNHEGLTPFDIAVEKGYWALGQTLKNISDTSTTRIDDILDSHLSDDVDGDDQIRDRFLAHGFSTQEINDLDLETASAIHEDNDNDNYSEVSWQYHDVGLQKSPQMHRKMQSLIEENEQLRRDEEASRQTCTDAAKAISILEKRCETLEKEKHDFITNMNEALLNSETILKLPLEEIESMEEQMRRAMDLIMTTKMTKLSQQVENSTCVVCQVEPKTVLLMPCRHLCICKQCSENAKLLSCPLCRRTIEEKIIVYS